jgi:hypothetical protein
MSKITLWEHSAISETLQAAHTTTPTENACSWGSHPEELSESIVIIEEVQESKRTHEVVNELIQENALLKNKCEDFEKKLELKDKALQDEKEDHRQTNEYLIATMLEKESLETKLTLVGYTILLKSTQN